MPPRRKQKSAEEKKEEAERQKKLLSTKEKIASIKRELLSIVEVMIEKEVSKEWFLANCTKLCHADYDDVIQERSIERLCGYPLCSNTIKQTFKQKYHISRVTNKVYDLTERKSFCSNECYKASKFLRAQLSPIPLYMRKEEAIKVDLLSECDNRGSLGEEVVFHRQISQDEIDVAHNKEDISNNLKNMLDVEVKKCADSLKDLQIKEHVFEKQFVFCEQTPKKFDNSLFEDEKESSTDDDTDSDDSLDEKLFPECDNISVLSNRYMPVPDKAKKTVLIPAFKHDTDSVPVQHLSLDFVINVFKDWMTEDSMKYLLGEKLVYGAKADHLLKRMTSTEPIAQEKLLSIKNEYIELCLKIDSMPDDDNDFDDSFELDMGIESSSHTSSSPAGSGNKSAKKAFKRRPKKKSDDIGNRASLLQTPKAKREIETISEEKDEAVFKEKDEAVFKEKDEAVFKEKDEAVFKEKDEAMNEGKTKKIDERKTETAVKEENNPQTELKIEQVAGKSNLIEEEEKPTESPVAEPLFPLVDSKSQNSLRRQLLTSSLKSIYSELLPVVGLHYTDIREAVRKFVDTLSLTPTNIVFKPKEWKLISVVLLRILTKTVLKDIQDELQLIKLYEDPILPIVIDVIEIEKVVSHIISVKNIIK